MTPEPKSGEVVIETPSGPVKMFLHRHAPAVAKQTKKWWVPTAITVLTALGGLTASKLNAFADGQDPRDKDIIALQETVKNLYRTIGPLKQRISFLEGVNAAKGIPSPNVDTPQTTPLDEIRIDERKLDEYKQQKRM